MRLCLFTTFRQRAEQKELFLFGSLDTGCITSPLSEYPQPLTQCVTSVPPPQLQQVNEAEAPQMDAADTDVDKKAVQRLVSKLRKTLERPEQADLELDPDGFLRLSALGGKFRREKMAPIVGLSTDVPISEITTKFKKVVNKGNPGVFEWQLAEDKTDMSVRLKGHAGAARAAARAEVELEVLHKKCYPLRLWRGWVALEARNLRSAGNGRPFMSPQDLPLECLATLCSR